MSTKRRRGLLGLWSACLLTAILTGCTPAGDLWATLDEDGLLVVAICEDYQASSISIRIQGADGAAWNATGDHLFSQGDEVSYGEPPSGFATDSGPLVLGPDDQIIVSVKSDIDGAKSLRGVFEMTDLRAGTWLSAGGASALEPC